MTESKLNLVVPKDYNGKPIEVVLREGEAPVALDPKEPERVVINGTIDAPFRWLEKRVELINQKETNIIVNRDKKPATIRQKSTAFCSLQKKCWSSASIQIRIGNLSNCHSF